MQTLTPEFLRRRPLPQAGDGGKEERGNILIVGGSKEVPGGALLAGLAALRSGAGRLQIATDEANASALAVALPEARVLALPLGDIPGEARSPLEKVARLAERADAVVLGPGLTGRQIDRCARQGDLDSRWRREARV